MDKGWVSALRKGSVMARENKLADGVMDAVEAAAEEYIAEIDVSSYTPGSKNSRIANVKRFVRWLKGEYVVGDSNSRQPEE